MLPNVVTDLEAMGPSTVQAAHAMLPFLQPNSVSLSGIPTAATAGGAGRLQLSLSQLAEIRGPHSWVQKRGCVVVTGHRLCPPDVVYTATGLGSTVVRVSLRGAPDELVVGAQATPH